MVIKQFRKRLLNKYKILLGKLKNETSYIVITFSKFKKILQIFGMIKLQNQSENKKKVGKTSLRYCRNNAEILIFSKLRGINLSKYVHFLLLDGWLFIVTLDDIFELSRH